MDEKTISITEKLIGDTLYIVESVVSSAAKETRAAALHSFFEDPEIDVVASVRGGAVDVKIAGSGNVKIASGEGGDMTASVAGSGDVVFGGPVRSLKARIAGSGDVRVKSVKGEVSKAVIGSGDVIVG